MKGSARSFVLVEGVNSNSVKVKDNKIPGIKIELAADVKSNAVLK